MSAFEACIFRVLRGSTVVGAAFLVEARLVVTCAHVIRSAGREPGETVAVRLADGREFEARILLQYWRDPNAEDVSILQLEEPLEGFKPLPLASSRNVRGHTFSTFGFPRPTQELAGRGEIIGDAVLNGTQLLQLDSRQVTPGFSGAPVFDEVSRRVVGMVVAITPPDDYQRQGTTAFAVPSETLLQVCSEITAVETSPYRSLDAFNENDGELFFGRERVVQKLLESLTREPRFLAVLGPSGSGKSSVARAGLVPALKRDEHPGSRQWAVLTFRPEDRPFEQLETQGLVNPQSDLSLAAKNWLNDHPGQSRLVLLIDQFEDILISTSTENRQKFITELVKALDAPVALTVIITMRDDFYSRLLKEAPALGNWIERGLVNIPPTITQAELEAIVKRPAIAAGLDFEEGLAETIVADVLARDPDDVAHVTVLPLLEFALTKLWEHREGNMLTHDAYRTMQGVTGGLSQWANEVYDGLDKNERSIARIVLELLVHPADHEQGTPDVRQARPIPEIIRENEILTQRTIDKLISARLLTVKRNPRTNEEIVEIIHDALLVEWGSLKSWLDEDRPFLEIQQQLTEAADDWKLHGYDKSYLFHGRRLTELQDWVSQKQKALSTLEREFLKASHAERRRQQMIARVFWGMASLLAIALLALGPGTWVYRELLRRQSMSASQLVRLEGGEIVFGTDDPEQTFTPGEPSLQAAAVKSVWFEATEVTMHQYDLCVRARRCDPPLFTGPVDLDAMARYPVTHVTLYQAMDYCAWVGRRLPDTYEWELAARGKNGRPWPWYNSSLPADDPHNIASDDKGTFVSDEFPAGTDPVGTHPAGASLEGIFDLYGNVWEWTSSVVDLTDNTISPWTGDVSTYLIQRGGAWNAGLERITQVRNSTASGTGEDAGFRCVQDAQP